MNEAVIKEEVIEEEHNFTFKNGEYVEAKQEEIEQKPEYLLEKEIKTERNDDFFENNYAGRFFEDVKQEPKESDSKIEKVCRTSSMMTCKICQSRMPRNLLKLIKTEDEKTVLSHIFNIEGLMEMNPMKVSTSQRRYCHICRLPKELSKIHQFCSKGFRMLYFGHFLSKFSKLKQFGGAKKMNEAIVKEEVIEETCNFTFINEQEIKLETNDDFFETNEPDEFCEDVKLEPKEIDSKIEKVSTRTTQGKCQICRKRMPRSHLTLIKSEDYKTVLSGMFKIEGSLEIKLPYVCVLHIRTIIDEYDGTFEKYAGTQFEKHLRTFISKHKSLMKDRKSRRQNCRVCELPKKRPELYEIASKNIRMLYFGHFLSKFSKLKQFGGAKKMNEAIVKEEVIEETCNFTFINGEYVEAKQEEIEQKPEYLLEQKIKTEIKDDFFEANEPDEYFEDVKLEPEEIDSTIDKVSTKTTMGKCEICQKIMPRSLLSLIKSEDYKTVLSENFKIEGSLEIKLPYVCVSHIQIIIDYYNGKLKSPSTQSEQLLRTFISKHKTLMKGRKSRKQTCRVCHMPKTRKTELYEIASKNIRTVIMTGCILRGTHSVESAMPYIENNRGFTCFSHCKESIDMIFEYLGMNDGVNKEEVIEEKCNFTFKNGEYVEIKQEEIERKPEYLLEREIKSESIDFFENNISDEFFEDVERKPRGSDSKNEKVLAEFEALSCKICWKRMPKNLLKLIMSEEDKTVLSEVFKSGESLETRASYVCVSHIKKIISDNDIKVKITKTPLGHLMRSFIERNTYLIRNRTSKRKICKVCHMSEDFSKLYQISSKGIRIALMIGCILRGTHSIDQAKSYIANKEGATCYSHRKETIDIIFEHLGISGIQEFLGCPRTSMGGLADIAKNFDSDFTVRQFSHAFKLLYMRKPKFLSSL
ncbi:hypothetical protein L3Y34_009530 [Caenorhabditis briggsae]|uniref:Lin-15A/B-like domain-containing protein n=1 Tax=Caenorhabditis briggsae TaxID=6238 RepID=A0AAE9AAE0_CAEBR|nr:hypothetical protein L3Y34_009530 [Caenorhabditis briggsae]